MEHQLTFDLNFYPSIYKSERSNHIILGKQIFVLCVFQLGRYFCSNVLTILRPLKKKIGRLSITHHNWKRLHLINQPHQSGRRQSCESEQQPVQWRPGSEDLASVLPGGTSSSTCATHVGWNQCFHEFSTRFIRTNLVNLCHTRGVKSMFSRILHTIYTDQLG